LPQIDLNILLFIIKVKAVRPAGFIPLFIDY